MNQFSLYVHICWIPNSAILGQNSALHFLFQKFLCFTFLSNSCNIRMVIFSLVVSDIFLKNHFNYFVYFFWRSGLKEIEQHSATQLGEDLKRIPVMQRMETHSVHSGTTSMLPLTTVKCMDHYPLTLTTRKLTWPGRTSIHPPGFLPWPLQGLQPRFQFRKRMLSSKSIFSTMMLG